jgi:S1-C subfamily serine protease
MMLTDTVRPRVSRETRRLLAAAGLALLALWILARLRFPERPTSPDPVSTMLTQISPPTAFADLAAETARVEQRIRPLLSVVTWQPAGDPRAFPAWPWRDDLAIAMVPSTGAVPAREEMKAIDRPTGLALFRVSRVDAPARTTWTPDGLEIPKYLFAATPAVSRPVVVPVYVSSLTPRRSPAWSTDIWTVPTATALTVGALVFTAAGEWLGIAARDNSESVIVPADALFVLATQLSRRGNPSGDFGVQVQDLDGALAAHSGASAGSGVIVAWVDPRGVAADVLDVGDIIETVNGTPTPTTFTWRVRTMRLAAGEKAALKVRRADGLHDATLIAPPTPPVRASAALGLTLAPAAGLGSRVTQISAYTAADRAGLQVGDIVTMAGDDVEPAPSRVRRAFDDTPEGGAVLLQIARGDAHRLVVLTR